MGQSMGHSTVRYVVNGSNPFTKTAAGYPKIIRRIRTRFLSEADHESRSSDLLRPYGRQYGNISTEFPRKFHENHQLNKKVPTSGVVEGGGSSSFLIASQGIRCETYCFTAARTARDT
jgi:hypothetical protein